MTEHQGGASNAPASARSSPHAAANALAARTLITYRPAPELKPVSESTLAVLGRLRRSAPSVLLGLLLCGAVGLAVIQSGSAIQFHVAAIQSRPAIHAYGAAAEMVLRTLAGGIHARFMGA
ncbi:MAG: hypothetical protein M3017_09025 [Actinomycetota bacterium]|nr:hypothetical protein [Actinomycetota bacterium]